MKRSEAIKKLANLLYEKCDFDCPNEIGAKLILDFVEEELGMEPPFQNTQVGHMYHWEQE